MAAGMPVGIMRTNLQRDLAIGGRHEADGYHGLEQQRGQQRRGDERVVAVLAEVSRHRRNEGTPMRFELQPNIENPWVRLEPLVPGDFEALYAVASDPLIWEQHPNKNRYQREVFATYFKGAIESRGALRIIDNSTGVLIGCSRYYEWDEAARSIAIGYTFIARSHWGGRTNRALKTLMLEHAFKFVDRVIFHVGAGNLRSRKAMEKLGGELIGEAAVAYYGEASNLNVIYKIDREYWTRSKPSI
jgi:RimJ/RimL family protein N-acetyltransferase